VAKAGGESGQLRMSNQDDLQGRNAEFPLDHILPVFNLNSKKESSFIPTFKAK